MAQIVLILGGVRSGKSRFARDAAERIGGDVLFIATAEAGDDEMRRRIEIHRNGRPKRWKTRQQRRGIGDWLVEAARPERIVIVDCLTLLVSNVLLDCPDPLDADQAEAQVRSEVGSLVDACRQRDGSVIIVSGEVGQGVVPAHPIARIFRDLLGMANQSIGQSAAAVYLMVAGFPVEVKSRGATLDEVAARFGATPKRRSAKKTRNVGKRSQ